MSERITPHQYLTLKKAVELIREKVEYIYTRISRDEGIEVSGAVNESQEHEGNQVKEVVQQGGSTAKEVSEVVKRGKIETSCNKESSIQQTAHNYKIDYTKGKKCSYCCEDHPLKEGLCPAWGKTCTLCGKKNHFSVSRFCPTVVKKYPCRNKNCRYCPLLNTTGMISSTSTAQEFMSKFNVNCKMGNLVYVITCKTCQQQYVGQTKYKLKDKMKNHLYKKSRKDQSIIKHFSKEDHKGASDVEIHVLEFIRSPRNSKRAAYWRNKKEKEWIQKLKCSAPHGMNTKIRSSITFRNKSRIITEL